MKLVSNLLTCIVLSYLHIQVRSESSLATALAEVTLSEDGKLNFTELARKYGHDAEEHDVVTEDGYILKTFYIPGEKPPILLFHGITDTADTFIIRGYSSLAITLANLGYAVCAGNNRGNKYGRRHVTLDPDTDKEFWDYSLHEVGFYDLPATIDFVRNKTGKESIVTIGHSQGTTAHFVLTSLRPEYNNRIKTFIALAPIAFLNNLGPPLSLVVPAGPAISVALKTLGIEELLKDRSAASNLITTICSKGIVSYVVCLLGVFSPLAGFDPSSLEPEYLSTCFGHYPAATSRKSLVHFDQIALRKKFGQYDYGSDNLAQYGTTSPPDYDLSAVTMPVVLLYAKNDGLSRVKDVEHLKESLPNVVRSELLEPELMNHYDFVSGQKMNETLYPVLLKIVEEFNSETNSV